MLVFFKAIKAIMDLKLKILGFLYENRLLVSCVVSSHKIGLILIHQTAFLISVTLYFEFIVVCLVRLKRKIA